MIRDIRMYGDPVLRAKGQRIAQVDDKIRQLAEDMLETMAAVNGVGLAAQQVGETLQLTVIDISDAENRPSRMWVDGEEVDPKERMPLVLVNPHLSLGSETEIGSEGCLSFPEITGEINRAKHVRVEATDLAGNPVRFEAEGLLARAAQHEFDHLQGVLFVDRMNSAAKASLSGRLKRMASAERT